MLLGLDAQNLNAKERHFILPLVIWTFIMQSVAFISSISHDRIKLIFSHTNKSYIFKEQFLLLALMTTYLEDLTQSIGRYGGLSCKTGLGVFGSTSSISTWCDEFG